jgi:hypothetical protein
LSLVATVVVGVTTGDPVGWLMTVGLITLTCALAFVTGIVIFVRDCNVRGMDVDARATCAAAQPAPRPSMWPAVAAVGVALVAVGLVTQPIVFQLGVVATLAAAAEWMIQGWSERTSRDRAYNDTVRGVMLHPLEFPVLATAGIAVIVFSFSRIMLFLSKTGGAVAFIVIAAVITAGGFLLAARPGLRKGVIGGICAIAALGLVSTGAVTAIEGSREIEEYPTVSSDPSTCLSAEPTKTDKKGSQGVGAKSNPAATIYLENGQLSAQKVGISGRSQTVTLPRSNPSHIMFVNLDEGKRRLTANLGTFSSEVNGTPVTEKPVTCTTLIEEGGRQMMTLTFFKSSAASETPYTFTVPGVEGSSIEIVVP